MAFGGELDIELDNVNDFDQDNEDNDDDEKSALLKDQIQSTSTHGGARSKTRSASQSLKIFKEINRETVKDKFTKMNDDIVIRISSYTKKLQISTFGSDEWIDFKKPNGKKNYFNSKIKEALGSSIEKLKSDYLKKIESFFPEIKKENFELIYKKDKFRIKIKGEEKIYPGLFNSDGRIRKIIDVRLLAKLGKTYEDLLKEKEEEIESAKKNLEDLENELENEEIDENRVVEINEEKNKLNETIAEGENFIENIQERTESEERIEPEKWKDVKKRIRLIFKKHGFTITAVISAVGAIIGVIVSNLKTGLAKLARGVGNGLKDIGKKLGAILPGMIGAIASFIFKTAGEVVGFLAKNAWLLIIAVVIFFVDQFKSGALTKSFKKKK